MRKTRTKEVKCEMVENIGIHEAETSCASNAMDKQGRKIVVFLIYLQKKLRENY